jgi:hypothetical protein
MAQGRSPSGRSLSREIRYNEFRYSESYLYSGYWTVDWMTAMLVVDQPLRPARTLLSASLDHQSWSRRYTQVLLQRKRFVIIDSSRSKVIVLCFSTIHDAR